MTKQQPQSKEEKKDSPPAAIVCSRNVKVVALADVDKKKKTAKINPTVICLFVCYDRY